MYYLNNNLKEGLLDLTNMDFSVSGVTEYDTYNCTLTLKDEFELLLEIPKIYIDNLIENPEKTENITEFNILKECFNYVYLRDTKEFEYNQLETNETVTHQIEVYGHMVDLRIDIDASKIKLLDRNVNKQYEFSLNQKLYKDTRELLEIKDSFEDYVLSLFSPNNLDINYQDGMLYLVKNFNEYINERLHIQKLVNNEYEVAYKMN